MNHLKLTTLMLSLATMTACSRDADPVAAAPVATKTVVFEVQGMHCDGCANAIATKANRIEGVAGCEVSLENGTATIEVVPDAIDDVEVAIAALGYTVNPTSP